MNYTIHLTDRCNLNCKYCYENKENEDISFENIKKLIDYEVKQKSKYSIITFYGGEPLLKKDLIKATIEYIKSKKSKTKFYYGITTNGTLVDDEFIKMIKENNFVDVAYSFDGMEDTQNLNRVTAEGKETFEKVSKNARKLLYNFENVTAMVVVTKNNLEKLSENVKYLISFGFESINLLFNYLDNWEDKDLEKIKEQYNNIAEIYYDKILKEEDIEIPLIDEKIKTYIKGYDCNEECNLGMKNINVGTDGNFYPCVQFVKNEQFIIGNCEEGIDFRKREKLILNSKKENDICKNCAIKKRCKHTCSCKNYMLTKDINKLSPIVCETEKIIIEVADKMAEKLHNNNSKMFIQKYYNDKYGIIKNIVSYKKGE